MERRYGEQREGKCKVVRRDKCKGKVERRYGVYLYTEQNRREGT
jgi:hypothetical protein